MRTPVVKLDLTKIAHNVRTLKQLCASKGVSIIGVTKGVSSDLKYAQTLCDNGIDMLGDSKIDNLRKMKDAGIKAQFVLLSPPALSELELVVKYADISLNTELDVLRQISKIALKHNCIHKVILMLEMGDMREGIMMEDIMDFIQHAKGYSGIEIVGIGANFACLAGAIPGEIEMQQLTSIAEQIEQEFAFPLTYISGGNSANYYWLTTTSSTKRINNLRLGESILLGCEASKKDSIPNLFTNSISLIAEVIELKRKPKGANSDQVDKVVRAILNIGNQDTFIPGLSPLIDIELLGSSSNHLVVDAKKTKLKVGDKVEFTLKYASVLVSMTSPNVHKCYIESTDSMEYAV